jgi:transcription elongation factor Elf1
MQTYKMNCIRCNKEMSYIPDSVLEARGYVVMYCENCKQEFLVPDSNEDLHIINE